MHGTLGMTSIATTKIPGRPDIELPAFYENFASYYPNCELQTKEWFVKNAEPDWVYFDCGANIGYYSILFSQLSPKGKVHALEPTSTAAMLEKNISHNRCQNVTIHQVAVGQYPGRRVEKIFRIWGGPPEELEYDFTTVDLMVVQLNLQRLDCVKIDVDSFDFEVLMGAEQTLERFDPWVVVELNHALAVRGYSNMAALTWLLDRGYRQCLVLDYDNFVLRRSASLSAFTTAKTIQLNFSVP
jgi:FkbM family methyltransferase